MSGLFDSLSARFAPGATPAIRPRPHSRFEGGAEGHGLREEAGESVVKAPEAAPTVRREPPSAVMPPEPAADSAPNPTQAPPPRADDAMPADPVSAQTAASNSPKSAPDTSNKPKTSLPETSIGEAWDMRGASPREAAPDAPPDSDTLAPAAQLTVITERVIETQSPAAETPIMTNQPAVAATRAAEQTRRAPDTKTDPPVIRIGRIEVTRPAPPAPPPQLPPTPVRREPPQRVAPMARAPKQSRLTDYLGWKK